MLSWGSGTGTGNRHSGECSLVPRGQAEALRLEGPGECWRVPSCMEARPGEAQLSKFQSFFAITGTCGCSVDEPRRGEWACVLMLG